MYLGQQTHYAFFFFLFLTVYDKEVKSQGAEQWVLANPLNLQR